MDVIQIRYPGDVPSLRLARVAAGSGAAAIPVENQFYKHFDLEPLIAPPVPARPLRWPDYRTPFEIHWDRIVHTISFRQPQSKTQVLLSAEDYFYRGEAALEKEMSEAGRSRLVGDAGSRMTDGAATRLYRRWSDAEFQSITDLG